MNSGMPMWSAQTQCVILRSRAIFTKSLTCLIAAALIFSNSVLAQTVTEIEAPITNLIIGTRLKAPSKVLLSLEETLTQCMGKVSEKALENHPTFESYWKASQNSRAGFTLEGVFSDTFNRRSLATAQETRIYPSSTYGLKHAAADLVEVDMNGKVVAQYQCKTYKGDIYKYLDDPKFQNMKFITTQNTLEIMQKELAAAKQSALTRNVALSDKMRSIDEALNSGKLLQKSPCGAPLPTRLHLDNVAREVTQKLYNQALRERFIFLSTGLKQETIENLKNQPLEAKQVTEKPVSNPKPSPTTITRVPDKTVKPAPTSTRSDNKGSLDKISTGGQVLKTASKALPVIAVAYDGYQRVNESKNIEEQYSNGSISEQQREISHTKNVAGGIGGFTGAVYGAGAGAEGGAVIGTFFGPVGTAAGGFVGGLVGGVTGAIVGDKVVGEAAGAATNAIHSTGTTIKSGASSTVKWIGSWVGW
jgi:hypothetical protein